MAALAGLVAGVIFMFAPGSVSARDAAFDVGAFLPYWGMSQYRDYDYVRMDTLYIQAAISRESVISEYGLIFKDPKGPDPYAQPDLAEIVRHVRSKNPGIKVVLSIADLHITDSGRAESLRLFDHENAERTIDYIMRSYIERFGFDGFALDIEGDSLVHLGSAYGRFVSAASRRLRKASGSQAKKLFYVFLDNADYRENYIDAKVTGNVDYIGVMDYGAEKMDYIVANPKRDLKAAAEDWSSKIDRSKLLLGIAGWGQYVDRDGLFVSDGQSYKRILELTGEHGAMGALLTTTLPGLASLPSGTMQRYNSTFEYRRKTEFAFYGDYGGVFFWDITKDPVDSDTSALKLIHGWKRAPGSVPRILGVTDRDFYTSRQMLMGRFHGLVPSTSNWVGIYDHETGAPTGRFQSLPEAESGSFSFPASVIGSLEPGKLYILRFFHGSDGTERELLGTSHPFHRL